MDDTPMRDHAGLFAAFSWSDATSPHFAPLYVDGVTLNSGTGGATLAADDIAGIHHQRVKVQYGADGAATDVSAAAPLPVTGNPDHTRNEAFSEAVAIGGELDDTAPVVATEGNVSPARITASRALHVNLRNNSGTELGIVATPVQVQVGDGTDVALVSAAGGVSVEVTAALPTGANNIGDVDVLTVPAPLSTTGGGTEATALRVTLANDSTGVVSVDDNGGAISVDWAGTAPVTGSGTATGALRVELANNGTGQVGLNAGTNNIGDVDVLTLPASTNTIEVVGDVAHDAAAAGNPVLVAASHETIADSAPTNRLATVTDGDATRLSAMDGAVFVIPSGPQQWKARLTGLIAADTTVKAAPGAGLSLYIQTVVFSIGAATASSILLEESTTTAVLGPHYLEAISGRGMAIQCNPPIKITANTLLSATGTGSTTATLDVYGFTGPG